jgi:hypothetical protein
MWLLDCEGYFMYMMSSVEVAYWLLEILLPRQLRGGEDKASSGLSLILTCEERGLLGGSR